MMTLHTQFIQTRRRNKIIAREIAWFTWSIDAIRKKQILHKTFSPRPKLEIPSLPKPSKEEKLKQRPFSQYHYKLINNLYGNDKENRILKQQAEKAAHELKIKRLALAIKHRELSRKQFKLEHCKKKIVISTLKNKQFNTIYSTNAYPILVKIMQSMNIRLSLSQPNYKAISLFSPHNAKTECVLFVNNRNAA